MAKINEDLKKKHEDSQCIISSLQSDIDQRNAFIAELQEKIQFLEEKLKGKEYILKSKEAEMLAIGEQLKSMISKKNKQKIQSFRTISKLVGE